MISQCPECGSSYPSHHGSVCKKCVAKKKSDAKPTVTTVKREISPIKKAEEPKAPPPPSMASARLGMDIAIPTPASKPKGQEEDDENTCPHCGHINDKGEMFCIVCKNIMLAGNKEVIIRDYQLSEIKEVSTDHINKLKKIGITTTKQLLEKASDKYKRKTVIIKTGISETFLIRMANQADLMRLSSMEPEHAYLLETIGINTLSGLKKKSGKDIMESINKFKNLLNSKKIYVIPDIKRASKWIDEANKTQPLVT